MRKAITITVGDLGVIVLLVLAAISVITPVSCRAWPEAQRDLDVARACLAVYHDETTAKTPTHSADVEALYQKMDSALGHASDLAK